MEILDKIGDSLTSTGKDISKLAKEVSKSSKINIDIFSVEEAIKKQYMELGRAYYDKHRNNETYEFEQCAKIKESYHKIEKMKAQLKEIKAQSKEHK